MDKHSQAKQRRIFLLLYTILFAGACVLVFRCFPEAGRRMVWKGDGFSQHYVALCYYARWGKAVLKSILEGHPAFPTFNMHMGFGADLFTTLQYYVIGDPFSLPAVFVPQKHMLLFHDAMIPLRMYFAGICFDGYCRRMGHDHTAANLCGALMYVFSSFVLFGMRHPYFLNAMIWFPLLLIGAERIFRGRKGRLFTAAVFLSCISNFYFFYMLVFLTVIYVVWRALRICLFPRLLKTGEAGNEQESSAGIGYAFREIALYAGKFLWRAVLGTAAGGVFMLPILLRFSQDPRASEGVLYSMLYPAEYYKGFAESFVGFGTKVVLSNWTCMGMGGIGLLGVLLLFFDGRKDPAAADGEDAADKKRGRVLTAGHPDLKIAFCLMVLMLLLPAAGAALNGFTYPANRWGWAFCMLTGYIAAAMLPALSRISAGRMVLVLLFMSVYAAVCGLLDARRSVILEIMLAAAVAAVVWTAERILRGNREEGGSLHVRQVVSAVCGILLTGSVFLTAVVHGYICFSKGVRNSGVEEYHTDQYISAMMASDAFGMRSLLGNEPFYRYSGRTISNNFALLNDVSDTQYYWSLSDSHIERFFTETGQYNGMVHLFDNLDNRTMLDEIAGVGYYKRGDGSLLPYGYEKMEGMHFDNRELFEQKGEEPFPVFSFSVYKNQYTLPLGFTADRYLTRETYDSLSIPQRQEALMQGILLEEEGVGIVTGQQGGSEKPAASVPSADAEEPAGPGTAENSGIAEAELSFTHEEVPFTAEAEDGIEVEKKEDGSIQLTVNDSNAALRLKAEEQERLSKAEIGILLTGMDYRTPEKGPREDSQYVNTDPVTISITAKRNDKTVSFREVEYTLADNPWKTGRSDFLSNCGYTDSPLSGLSMKFSRKGVYTFREMKIIRQPMEEYPAQARALGQYGLEELDLHELPGSGATDRITGRLTIPAKRILCVQIPPCDGLRAFVDGEEVPLLEADTMFSAMAVGEGRHEIELRYRTPGLAAGAGISAAALLLLVLETLTGLIRKKKKKTDKKNSTEEEQKCVI